MWQSAEGLTTDTRQIKEGWMFVALKGEKFDANDFAQQAIDAGAAWVIVDKPEAVIHDRCVLVPDTLRALQALANHHRLTFSIPFLAVGGSNGKTTTKELIRSVVGQRFKVHATAGNLNNHIGVPLTILQMPLDTEFAVIEIGANHLFETAELAAIVEPNFGIITNNGKDHLEGFGSIEQVKQANAELYEYLLANNASCFVNADDADLMAASEGLQRFTYGASSTECNATIVEQFPNLAVQFDMPNNFDATSNLAGDYNLPNILAAARIGFHFGLTVQEVKAGIEAYTPANNRSQWKAWNTNQVLMDCYNANPSSMAGAVQSFAKMPASPKYVILGDMFELGQYADEEHQAMLQLVKQLNFDTAIFIGANFYKFKQADFGFWFENTASAKEFLQKEMPQNAFLLTKASRGMALEKLFD
jgi:UDP-N-acetylmuramoyl-tripeptide--D-alanyl-D-alanine ligase